MDHRGLRHYPCLDGLRGLAILLVIPHNADILVPVLRGPFAIFTLLNGRGWIGVQLFFVLSGFLITEQLYLSRSAPNYFGGFYARRILRIVPLFIAAVALAIVLRRVLGANNPHGAATPGWVLWLGLFFINWTEPFGLAIPGFPQFWSLAVEEQFYLVWPAVVRAFATRLFAVGIAITVVALAVRLIMVAMGARPDTLYMWTICRMDALALGALAALIVQRWRVSNAVPRPWPWVTCAVAIALAGALLTRLYALNTWPTQTIGYTCLGLACTLLLLAGVANDLSARRSRLFALLRSRPLASLGRYSYGMYVFHMFFVIYAGAWLQRFVVPFGDARQVVWAVLVIALSYAAGFLSYHLYEKHFLRLGRYFAAAPPASSTVT
jgi:peptidoglycan/LPS O-acetylase OafA/YrhL